jgi:chromosome segregation protein
MPSRLKSLELHGYKTFANRTVFEFADTVTAIVGPNGSGKSNIADSLRWVLGEQSYSLLRAKKTEDMIFSGSENRPRAGLASATITFDNSDNWLPIDFSEVAITRRAHRDGLNEYLINGQRVRLKDVSELLAQSGLAERTYTVIGQGLVDAALSLRADERRRLFEEAAGIGLHRSRREEVLRRLETTRRNLERVEDILAELKPRLGSLERQARRAQEYEQVRADLQVLLREWYGYHWHNSQNELAEARQAVQTQEAKLAEAQRQQVGIDEKMAGLRQQAGALRTDLNGWHRTLAELHRQREAFSRDLAVSEERERALHDQQAGAQASAANLDQEVAFHQEQLIAVAQEMERLSAELAESKAQLDTARRAMAARQAERTAVERSIQTARQELSGLNARQGQGQARLAESQAQVERLRKSVEGAVQGLAKAERERQAADNSFQTMRHAVQRAEQAYQTAEESLAVQRQRGEAADMLRRQAQDERSALAAELARLKAQINVLEQAEAAFAGYASGTRLLLQAARQQRLAGARGALSSFLEAPPTLEKAIAAALGEFLDAVLLESDSDQALDLLQDSNGRGVILPLDRLQPPASLHNLPEDEDVLGVAATLVQAPDGVKAAVDLLLGQVIIVRDRRAARRALESQPHGVRAVTLRGEVLYASGPASAGSGGESASEQTLLSRGRQRREAQAARSRVEAQLGETDAQLAQLDGEVKRLRQETQRAQEAVDQARQELQKSSRALDQARAALDAADRQVRWAQDQRQRLDVDQQRNQSETTRLAEELAGLDKRLGEVRQTLRQHNAQLEALSLDEFQAQLAHWSTRSAVTERALSETNSRQQERQTMLERSRRSQAELQTRVGEWQTALQTLQARRAALRQDETAVSEKIAALNAQIEPAEAGLQDLEKQQAGLQQSEAAGRQGVSMAEHFHAQTRITLARRQEALQSLQRRIEEDFGLVAFEYTAQVSGPTPLPLGGMVEQLPIVRRLSPDIDENIKRQRAQLRRIGAVNPEAQAEYLEVKQRFEFLTGQVKDLEQAEQDVRRVIEELDVLMEREFRRTFEAVGVEFRQIFTRLFGGGTARLLLTDPNEVTTTGIEIEARLPGRRMQSLSLLSGGERSLTAAALVFALLKVSPTPFCVLDEVDAMLDEANVGRFRDLLRELSERTQFLIVTHNRNTVQVADIIYGITMGRDTSSQVLSLKLDEVNQVFE